MNISLSAFAPENSVSRDGFGSSVSRQPAHLHIILRLNLVLTYGIPPEFRGGVHLSISNRHTASGQSRVYRVTQLRTDSVHCRESAGTGPVNLKVVPNEECFLGRSPWTNLYAPLFPTPTIGMKWACWKYTARRSQQRLHPLEAGLRQAKSSICLCFQKTRSNQSNGSIWCCEFVARIHY